MSLFATRLTQILAAVACMAIGTLPAHADRIFVKNGSLIKGKAIIDDAHPDQYLVVGEKGKTPIVLKKDRVLKIEPEASVLDDYAVRRKALHAKSQVASVEDEYLLAVWCQEHKLSDLAVVHFETVLKRDPKFGPAHQKLGHTLLEGNWLNATELKVSQGYVLFKGKWLTPEEKEHRDAEVSATSEQKSWLKRLSLLKQAMINGPEARAQEAETQLLAIRDHTAIRPVVTAFGIDEDPAFRKLAARILGGISGPEASSALVTRLLNEPLAEVREATLAELKQSKQDNVIPRLVLGLRSESEPILNRAAWALGNLNAVSSVPKLIGVLVTNEVATVMIPSANANASPGVGFNAMPNNSAGYGFSMSGGKSIPILTGPTVGPGVVAYGAGSIPASSLGVGNNISIGGSPDRGPTPQLVAVSRPNVQVYNALVKLTGQDFGYDVQTWHRWMRTTFQTTPAANRRVAQP